MEILGTRMGPSSVQEGPTLKEMKDVNLPNLSPKEKPTSFAKALESRKTPQETRPAETRRSEKLDVRERIEDAGKPAPKIRKNERETAMLQFMDSMESEFGITPARMLEALADLDNEDLARTPEDTASDVIANLDLPAEDEPQAMEMYLQFLQVWRNSPAGQQWRDMRAANDVADPNAAKNIAGLVGGGAILQAGMDVKQGAGPLNANKKRNVLNQSLDRMNDKFFMRGPLAETGIDSSKTAETMSKLSELGFEKVEPQLITDPRLAKEARVAKHAEFSAAKAAESAPALTGAETSAMAAGETTELESMLRQLNADPLAFRAEVNQAAAQSLGAKPMGATAEPKILDISALQIPGFGSAAAIAKPEGLGDSSLGANSGDAESDGSGEGLAEGRADAQLLGSDFSQVMRAEPGAKAAVAAGTGQAGAFALTDTEAQGNLEALKDQTQIIAMKGGGEARIKLNQDGLGEVQLKVLVHDGKVNVEMKTDNAEAKKILESSIADLKQGLAAHKLSVDNVKVDVGTSDAGQQQQRQMDFQQDMGRQQARQMMEQFRQDSASRRDPFFEMSGIKAYGRKRADLDPIAPAGNTAPRVMSGRGERMNLVA